MILAAGFGSRLGTLSDERPKPLLPVAGVPLVRWALALLRGAGIAECVINLHHRGALIERELAAPPDPGVRVAWSREQAILGTGGGIRRALPLLGSGPIVIVNGKLVFDVDLADVVAAHRASGAAATLVVRPDPDAATWGAIDAPDDGGPIRAIRGATGAHMFTGVHVVEPSLVARLPDDGAERCIVRQGYVPWLAEGVPIHAYVARGYFMEHSTPARYLEGNANVLHGRARVRHAPPGIAGVDAAAIVDPTATIVPPVRLDAGAVIEAGATVGPTSVVGRDARVRAGVRVIESIVWPDAVVDADATRAIVTPTQRVQG